MNICFELNIIINLLKKKYLISKDELFFKKL